MLCYQVSNSCIRHVGHLLDWLLVGDWSRSRFLVLIAANCYRTRRITIHNCRKEGSADVEKEEYKAEIPMEDLVPRQDITSKLSEELCDELKDKNWKIRREGLDEV